MKIYFIEGKKIDLDSSEWDLIYKNGQWSNTGINLFFRKKDKRFILEIWNNYQGKRDYIETMTRKEAIDYLINHHSYDHPERVNETFQKIHYFPELF